MRKHRVIREFTVAPGSTFLIDIETQEFANLLVTFGTSDDSVAPPSAILVFPTNARRAALAGGNFPGLPPPPPVGANAYAAIGPNMITALPLPAMVTVGAVTPAGCTVAVKVEGDFADNILQNPEPLQVSRS